VKKKLLSLVFILVGSGLWWSLAHTARFSIKKWDAKFGSVLRHGLTEAGLADKDLLTSVYREFKDDKGSWIIHELSVKELDKKKIKQLKRKFEDSGARVELKKEKRGRSLIVKRGGRTYQIIHFKSPS